ncbi:hypothetical protein EI94DRAFT_1707971 [Lactarius quietus]|nr:hypothetical protein EI94DRAFT_1707971 [Lactarius quietus]
MSLSAPAVGCPLWHVCEEAESALSTAKATPCNTSGIKHKVAETDPYEHHASKVVINVDNTYGSNDGSDEDSNDGAPTEPTSNDYEVLKAMANEDNLVHLPTTFAIHADLLYSQSQAANFKSQADHTADVHRICPSNHWKDCGWTLVYGLNDTSVKRSSCFMTRSTSSL